LTILEVSSIFGAAEEIAKNAQAFNKTIIQVTP